MFNVHIQSKLLLRTFVVDVVSDLGQPFRPRQKNNKLGLGWEGNRLSRYDIRAEGVLPSSITVITRFGLMHLQCFS